MNINIDTSLDIYNGSGGFGDALMCMNKYKKLGLHLNPHGTLQHWTEQQSAVILIEKLFALNDIQLPPNGEYLVHYKPGYVNVLKEIKNKQNTFTTTWNGNIENNESALQHFESDFVEIEPFMDIKGEPISIELPDNFFILQLDAGLMYHNDRKHWKNPNLALGIALPLLNKYNLECFVIGGDNDKYHYNLLDKRFHDLNLLGFQSIEIFKKAKFVIGLSSFVTLLSCMLKIPTIYKKENDHVHSSYYSHPEWSKVLTPIDELDTDLHLILEKIKQYVGT